MRAWLVGGVALVTVAAGGGALAASRAGEALPGTTVDGVAVGGQARAQVVTAVERLAGERTAGALPVTAAEVRASVPRSLVTVDTAVAVDRALARGGPVGLLFGDGTDVALTSSADPAGVRQRVAALATQVDRAASAGGITITGLTVAEQQPVAGRTLDRTAAALRITTALEDGAAGPVALPVTLVAASSTPAQIAALATQARAALAGPYVLGQGDASLRVTPSELAPLLRSEPVDGVPTLRLDTVRLKEIVTERAAPLAVAPRSAAFTVAAPATPVETKGDLTWTPRPAQVGVRPGANGRAVDVDLATSRLAQAVLAGRRTASPLPAKAVAPTLTTDAAKAARVRTLIGTFTTRFPAGQPRATNIRRIAEIVDGTYVAAGDVLSLNDTAGRRTRERGFVADGAIVDGELTDEVGGGVSQFATTLFNAAFFAGLPILEHKPHSFYISRYPAGRESTVYFNAVDVKVENDSKNGLLVRTRSTPGSVTVELYGDNGGRRVTSTSGPRRARADGGFDIAVTRLTTGGDGQGGRRVFRTTYVPVPPDRR